MRDQRKVRREIVGRTESLNSQVINIQKMEELLGIDGRNITMLRIIHSCGPLIQNLVGLFSTDHKQIKIEDLIQIAQVEVIGAVLDYIHQKQNIGFSQFVKQRILLSFERELSNWTSSNRFYSDYRGRLSEQLKAINESLTQSFRNLDYKTRSNEKYIDSIELDLDHICDKIDQEFKFSVFKEEELYSLKNWNENYRKNSPLFPTLDSCLHKSTLINDNNRYKRRGLFKQLLNLLRKFNSYKSFLNGLIILILSCSTAFIQIIYSDFDELVPRYDERGYSRSQRINHKNSLYRSSSLSNTNGLKEEITDPNEPYFIADGIAVKNAGKKVAEEVRIESAQSLYGDMGIVSNTTLLNGGDPIKPGQRVSLESEGIYLISFITTNREMVPIKRTNRIIVKGLSGIPSIEIFRKASKKGELPQVLIKSPAYCEIDFKNQYRFGEEIRETPFEPIEDNRSLGPRSIFTLKPRKTKTWPETGRLYIGYQLSGQDEKIITRVVNIDDVLEGDALNEWKAVQPEQQSHLSDETVSQLPNNIISVMVLLVLILFAGLYYYKHYFSKKTLSGKYSLPEQIQGKNRTSLPNLTVTDPKPILIPFWHNKLISQNDSLDPDVFAIDDLNGRRLYLSQLASSINKGNSYQFVLDRNKGIKLPENKRFYIKQSAGRARPLLCTYNDAVKKEHYKIDGRDGMSLYLKGERRNGKTTYSIVCDPEGTYCFQPVALALKICENNKYQIECLNGFKGEPNIEFKDFIEPNPLQDQNESAGNKLEQELKQGSDPNSLSEYLSTIAGINGTNNNQSDSV